jgi:hypothetical protein
MRGHIRERSRGHWAIVIDVRDAVTGFRLCLPAAVNGGNAYIEGTCFQLAAILGGGLLLSSVVMSTGSNSIR